MSKSIKTLNDKLKSVADYSNTKNENFNLKDKVSSLEGDNASLRIHNVNIQKNNEKIVDKLNEEIKRNEDLKFEVKKFIKKKLLDFKNAAKNSSEQLKTALNEMNSYGLVLQGLEDKMKRLEDARISAEKERDIAKDEMSLLRQRYINLCSDSKF